MATFSFLYVHSCLDHSSLSQPHARHLLLTPSSLLSLRVIVNHTRQLAPSSLLPPSATDARHCVGFFLFHQRSGCPAAGSELPSFAASSVGNVAPFVGQDRACCGPIWRHLHRCRTESAEEQRQHTEDAGGAESAPSVGAVLSTRFLR